MKAQGMDGERALAFAMMKHTIMRRVSVNRHLPTQRHSFGAFERCKSNLCILSNYDFDRHSLRTESPS